MPLPQHAQYLIIEALRKRPHSAETLKEQLAGAPWVDQPLEEYERFLGTLREVVHAAGIYSVPSIGASTVRPPLRDREWQMTTARREASSKSTNPTRLSELVWVADDNVRLAVAANPSAPPGVLRALCLLAEDLKFLRNQGLQVRKELAWFGAELPSPQLQKALREAVKSNPSLPPALALRLRRQSESLAVDIPSVAASSMDGTEPPAAGAQGRGQRIGAHQAWRIRVYRRQAADKATTANRLAEIAAIDDDDVKLAIAANPSSSAATLWELCLVPRRIELLATGGCAEEDPQSWFGGILPSQPFIHSLRELVAANSSAPVQLVWALTKVSPIVERARAVIDDVPVHVEAEIELATAERAEGGHVTEEARDRLANPRLDPGEMTGASAVASASCDSGSVPPEPVANRTISGDLPVGLIAGAPGLPMGVVVEDVVREKSPFVGLAADRAGAGVPQEHSDLSSLEASWPPEVRILASAAGLYSDASSVTCGDYALWVLRHPQPVIGGRYVVTLHAGEKFRPQELSEILRVAEDLDAIRTIILCTAEISEAATAFAIGRPVLFVHANQIESRGERQGVATIPRDRAPATVVVQRPAAAPPLSAGHDAITLDVPDRDPADVVAEVIRGATYSSQVQRAGRGAPTDALVALILMRLLQAAGKAHVDRVSAATGLSPHLMPSTLTVLKRVLNIDGYQVLEFDPRSGWVTLDEALLRAQFVR